jgi:hypothetical protein
MKIDLGILAAWEHGECGERYLCAGGSWIDCARSAGHGGSCSYRAEADAARQANSGLLPEVPR